MLLRRCTATLLAVASVLLFAAPATAAPDPLPPPSYAGFRLVKAIPGEPGTPRITLPVGYELVTGASTQVASRAEYYSFVRGPRSEAVTVTVDWPGTWVGSVVATDTRLAIRRHAGAPYRISFTLPVTWSSVNANQATVQVWSMLSPETSSGLHWRIEHNDPDRVAGPWTTVAWPATQAASVINYLVATEAVLQDSGLVAEARRKGHFFSLMGFETNNVLHPDNPPHWHLAYYPGLTYSAPRAHVPHFWVDAQGRTYYNGMDIQGQGRSRFYAGDPAQIHDPENNLVVTLTIRADGGLDIDPPAGPRYSVTAPDGDFSHQVDVSRDGVPWRSVVSRDHVKIGVLVTQVKEHQSTRPHRTTVYQYDALTGVLTNTWPGPH
ncbi:hypothetical protein C6361_25320 [Plantactinospora sp. BC1]|uniref:hypothetical protein n=1 Tax=Plantactinospora sp. BC1 TaxID=2108470 RepID=UPI000D15775B|nr:hypothetical protein [Plantactinospora sp. BC1]AVT32229.1 hypothetical protein C6361_25320 [Plantactinospora sp. BC1]